MKFIQLKKMKKKEEEEEEEVLEPVSPTAQHLNSSTLSVTNIAVFELENHSDDSFPLTLFHLFLPINSRFSSIMVTNDHGEKKWKRVNVKLEDHIKIPNFTPGLSEECYDICLDDYLSKIAEIELPKHQPLWEIHMFKYPTTKAVETLIFKLHHALGDGFSLMGALFSRCHRVDDPSVPVSLPSLQSKSQSTRSEGTSIQKNVTNFLSLLLDTATDFTWSLMKSSIIKDDISPIRSGTKGIEFHPVTFSTITFSLEDIKRIKNKVKGSVNDVLTGIIFYGSRIYMQKTSKASCIANSTAIILLNTRVLRTYQTINEIASSAKSTWGNQFAFVHVSIPKTTNADATYPLEFIQKTKEIMKKKRSSLAVYLIGRLLQFFSKLSGPKIAERYIHRTIMYSSMGMSNMIGPSEQIAVSNHRFKGMYFMTTGVPSSVRIGIMSYMKNLRVSVGTEKEYIDHKLFISSLDLAFNRIFDAALALP